MGRSAWAVHVRTLRQFRVSIAAGGRPRCRWRPGCRTGDVWCRWRLYREPVNQERRGRHTSPQGRTVSQSKIPAWSLKPAPHWSDWSPGTSQTYGQGFVQLPRPVVEAVEHQVFSHAVNPLPAGWHSATHKVGSFLPVWPESFHSLSRTRDRNEILWPWWRWNLKCVSKVKWQFHFEHVPVWTKIFCF